MFWFNLVNLPDNRLIKQVFLESKLKSSSKCNWYRQIGDIFKKYDLSNIWSDNNLIFNLPGSNNKYASVYTLEYYKNQWKSYVRKKILVYEEKEWCKLINNKDKYSKLRTYCTLKLI